MRGAARLPAATGYPSRSASQCTDGIIVWPRGTSRATQTCAPRSPSARRAGRRRRGLLTPCSGHAEGAPSSINPLYSYLVGLTYRVIGDDVRFVFGWQMGLGVMSTVLIWLLARRFFGDLVGACAGALAVLCGPLVYYELFLLRESTIVFAGLGVVWLADRALTRGSWALFVLLGFRWPRLPAQEQSRVLGGAVALGIVLSSLGVARAAGAAAATLPGSRWPSHRWRENLASAPAVGSGCSGGLTSSSQRRHVRPGADSTSTSRA